MLKRVPLKRGNSTLKKTSLSRRKKSVEEIEEDKYESDKMTAFFEYCRDNLPLKSIITGVTLRPPVGRINFHHIYPKSIYRVLQYSLGNIAVLTAGEHETVENNPSYYPKVNDRKEIISLNMDYFLQESEQWSDRYDQLHKQ